MRTNSFVSFMALVVLFISATIVSAADFTAPADGRHYGVTTTGIYFISQEMVDAVEGSSPKVRTAKNGWMDESMTLNNGYYTWDSGAMLSTAFAVTWCVNIGGNRFLPHALEQAENPGKYIRENEDIVENGVGGYNFRTKPINK